MEFDLTSLPLRDRHALLTRVVAPRPIALVSSLSSLGDDGRGNLAPFSYFMLGGAAPPSVAFCPVNDRQGAPKDTLRNVQATGEYVISVVTPTMAAAVNQASYPYAHGHDEFDSVGLTRAPSRVVRPPGVGESPIRLECRLFTVVPHGDGPGASSYVIGEVLHVSVDDALVTDGLPDNAKLDVVARLGADYYARIGASTLFELPRPTTP
jgi:flavin reductase (DIM6/NTAB) family NADH-FMN oxidoreductase RutF